MSTLKQSVDRLRAERSEADRHLCFSTQLQPPALTVEADGERWVLPWMHFVFARHWESGEAEQLVITFASHEVVIQGCNLILLAEEAARLRLECLREMPPNYREAATDEPFAENIRVRPVGEGQPPKESRSTE